MNNFPIPESLSSQAGATIGADSGIQRGLLAQVAVGMQIHPRRWVKVVASAGTPQSLTDFSITSIATSGLVATVTATAHQLVTGDIVTQRGATGVNASAFNRTVTVTVVDANTYTYALQVSINGASSAGTVIGNVLILTGRTEMLNTAGSGTAHYGIVSGNGNQLFPIGFGTVATILPPVGRVVPLGDFYYDVNADGEGVELLIYPSYNPQ